MTLQEQMLLQLKGTAIFEAAIAAGNDYASKALTRNLFPTQQALDELTVFNEPIPSTSTDALEVIQLLHKYGSPATLPTIGGRYFGFVNGGVVPAGLAAKLLASFWDQNSAMHVMSPVASYLEKVVERWLRTLLGLPETVVAGFVSGTSTANLSALAAARYRLLKNQGWDAAQQGLIGAPRIRILAGREAHSSVMKALSILGFGIQNVELIDVDEQGRIIPERIPALDNKTLLILQAGNVNSGAFDNFEAICRKAKDAGAWIHVDGAFGLWAAASRQLKHLTNGMEHATSWAADGHKTLNTPYDSGIVLCNDREALTGALSSSGAYFILTDDRDGMFYTPEMSRRARIFELWATMKYLGASGIDEMIFTMHQRAKQFAKEIATIHGFTVLNEVVFNQVVVACDNDDMTTKVLAGVQQDRVCWAGGSVWRGRKVIRISVCSWATTENDISLSVESFKRIISLHM